MWHIEYGADWADSYEIHDTDWNRAMLNLSKGLTDHMKRGLITSEEFISAMEWASGVVIEDEDVRVPGRFEDGDGYGLTVAITLTGEDD